MTKGLIIVLMLLLSGCGGEQEFPNPARYKCTENQLQLVEKEYEICERSSYHSSFCFAQAKSLHCEDITKREG